MTRLRRASTPVLICCLMGTVVQAGGQVGQAAALSETAAVSPDLNFTGLHTSVGAVHLSETAAVSPDLNGLVRGVLDDSPRLLAARSMVEAAQARARASGRPFYNPELTLDAERAESDVVSLQFTQAVDWADKRDARAISTPPSGG